MAEGTIAAAFPLTPLQEGMLYHTLREPDAGVYHVQCTATLIGELDDAAFREAWRAAVRRHPALRTFFAWTGRERPLQVVRADATLDVVVHDWRGASEAEQGARWEALLAADRRRGFELASAPLARVAVARVGERRHRLLWAVHHALVDGWSGILVLDEVLRDHATLSRGGAVPDGEAPSFDRFVGWTQAQDAAAAESHWRAALGDLAEPTPLPGGRRARGASRTVGGERLATTRTLDADETARLQAAAAGMRVTLNTLLMGAWAALLARHAGADDVVFGVTVSERPAEIDGVEGAVGLYLATVPLRCRITDDAPVASWLRGLQLALGDARAHAAPGLAAIQRWSAVPAGVPLFESLVVFENLSPDMMRPFVARDDGAGAGSPELTILDAAMSVPNDVPLVLLALPGERLTLTLLREPGVASADAAGRLVDGLVTALAELARDGGRPVGAVETLGAAERAVVERWSASPVPAPPAEDVLTLFERRAATDGAAVALRTEHAVVTYAALDADAARVADRLHAGGVRAGALVGVLAERSPELLAAMLGALKAGAGYVPLDVEAPAARLATLTAPLDAVLAAPALAGRVASHPNVVPLDGAAEGAGGRRRLAPDPSAPAYVMHTSGSTGEPKGVVVERAQLAASTAARFAYYGEAPRSFLLLSSPAVDSAVAGIYWALCGGGTLVLPRARAEQDVGALARLVEEAGATHALLVPSLHRTLLEHADPRRLASLRCVVVAGEACPPELVRLHVERLPGVALHNEYGPTEATVWATADLLTRDPDGPVTIGRPVPGARVHLLDDRRRPVPVGAVGEICIGGPLVARGYLDRPAETAERFVADPVHPAGRLYRTGDRGRFLDDGRIEFLGRVDEQLKVRGFRVEPAEIERALREVPGVREAAVALVRPTPASDVDALTDALLGRDDADVARLLAVAEARS